MNASLKSRLARLRRIAAKVLLLAALLVIAEVAGQTSDLVPPQTDGRTPPIQAPRTPL